MSWQEIKCILICGELDKYGQVREKEKGRGGGMH